MSTSKPQTRTPLSARQRSILTAFYEHNPYPSSSERHQLVQWTGRTPKQVQDWFSNRRRTDPKLLSTRAGHTSHPSETSSNKTMEPTYITYPSVSCPPPVPFNCPCCSHMHSPSRDDQLAYPIYYPVTYYGLHPSMNV